VRRGRAGGTTSRLPPWARRARHTTAQCSPWVRVLVHAASNTVCDGPMGHWATVDAVLGCFILRIDGTVIVSRASLPLAHLSAPLLPPPAAPCARCSCSLLPLLPAARPACLECGCCLAPHQLPPARATAAVASRTPPHTALHLARSESRQVGSRPHTHKHTHTYTHIYGHCYVRRRTQRGGE